MIDPKTLDELAQKIYEVLPQGTERLQEDLRRNVRSVLAAALAHMDLVTREEFDVQSAVLGRTREKLDRLEEKLAGLEQDASGVTPTPDKDG